MLLYNLKEDKVLLDQIKQGDERAFEQLYNRYFQEMASYIIRVIGSEEEAKDIIQEIFVSLWKRRKVFEIEASLKAYLLKSARNLALKYIERNLSKSYFLDSLIEATTSLQPPVVSTAELKELEQELQRAIDRLPSKMREIFYLSRFENHSYIEIAEKLRISDTTVKKQISNALKRIRKCVSGDGRFALLLMCMGLI